MFSLPNAEGAVDAATLFTMSAQEFADLAAPEGLLPGPVTDDSPALPGGAVASRSQVFTSADGSRVAQSRTVVLQHVEALLAQVRILHFSPAILPAGKKSDVGYAAPLLWTKQDQEVDLSIAVHCEKPIGLVLITGGEASLLGETFAKSQVLDSQPSEAETWPRSSAAASCSKMASCVFRALAPPRRKLSRQALKAAAVTPRARDSVSRSSPRKSRYTASAWRSPVASCGRLRAITRLPRSSVRS